MASNKDVVIPKTIVQSVSKFLSFDNIVLGKSCKEGEKYISDVLIKNQLWP